MNMKGFAFLLAAVAAVAMSGCAVGQKASGSPPSPHRHAVNHTEVCVAESEEEIAALFDRWNNSLKTGDPNKVADNYAPKSVLIATLSKRPRLTREDKIDYFHHFLENKPVGRIDSRSIEFDCNTAVDGGLYTFTFGKTGAQVSGRYTFTYKWDGQKWLITSHHSSRLESEEIIPTNARHAITEHSEACEETDEKEIASLFDRWNDSLKTGHAHSVVANYAATSVLIPLLSNRPLLTLDDKEDYFHYFLKKKPVGHIDQRTIEIDCNTAIDEGLYTFNFEKTGTQIKGRYTFMYKWDGYDWLIANHHSSALPPGE